MTVTPGKFVRIMAAFPTGVAVVTVTSSDGTPRRLTTHAVTGVSLRPPILLVRVNITSHTLRTIGTGPRFAVNFMRSDAEQLCLVFASKGDDKFEQVPWRPTTAGAPLLHQCAIPHASSLEHDVELGDHAVLAGLVSAASPPDGDSEPILYFRRSFHLAPSEAA